MIRLFFEGWFQCRLATDPDPPDETRGVSGWTFAVAGEPDLDRIIRLQPAGTVPRLGGPTIGVTVTRVEEDGAEVSTHPLVGAAMMLASSPVFDGRNHIEAEDGREPIRPFELIVEKAEIRLSRTHVENGIPGSPDGLVDEMGPLPKGLAQRLGIANPLVVRSQRKTLLEKRLAEPDVGNAERAALGKRISELSATDIQVSLFSRALPYRFAVNGVATFVDGGRTLSEVPDDASPWPIEFFMGAWDADALCGYMSGHWDVSLRVRI